MFWRWQCEWSAKIEHNHLLSWQRRLEILNHVSSLCVSWQQKRISGRRWILFCTSDPIHVPSVLRQQQQQKYSYFRDRMTTAAAFFPTWIDTNFHYTDDQWVFLCLFVMLCFIIQLRQYTHSYPCHTHIHFSIISFICAYQINRKKNNNKFLSASCSVQFNVQSNTCAIDFINRLTNFFLYS